MKETVRSTRVDEDRVKFPLAAICDSAREFHICHKAIWLGVCGVRSSQMWWSFIRNCNNVCVMIIVWMFLFIIVMIFSMRTTPRIVPRKPIVRSWKTTPKLGSFSGPGSSSISSRSTPSSRKIIWGAQWTFCSVSSTYLSENNHLMTFGCFYRRPRKPRLSPWFRCFESETWYPRACSTLEMGCNEPWKLWELQHQT